MFKLYCMILLLGHVLGDFYLQSPKMAVKKEEHMSWVIIHSISYLTTTLVCVLTIARYDLLMETLIIGILHALIDSCKYIYLLKKKAKRKKTPLLERNVFLFDQFLHMICIIGIAYYHALTINTFITWNWINDLTRLSSMTLDRLVGWFVAILIIHKPANIIIQKILMPYKLENTDRSIKKDLNAGRMIGSLERFIMLIFLAIGQYAAIGLVLTAKSIARYDRIAKEQDFAEYYLLGTLLSTAFVLVISNVI